MGPLLPAANTRVGTPGPFTLQGLLGCELGPDNVSVPVAKFALNGEEFMMFDPKLGIWDGDWPESRTVSIQWTKQPEAVNKEKTFLLYSCPHRLLGHLERGRGNLEWKGERPPDHCRPPPFPGPHPLPQPLPVGPPDSSPPCSPTILSLRVFLHPQRSPAPLLHTACPRGTAQAPRPGIVIPRGMASAPQLSLACLHLLHSARYSHPEPLELAPALPFLHLCQFHWCQGPLVSASTLALRFFSHLLQTPQDLM